MRRELIMRNVICPEDAPSGFDIGAFEEGLDLGPGENTMRVDNLSVTEWEKVRLQILPDRLQLGFKKPADGDLVRRVVESFAKRRDELAPGKAFGFNAAMVLTREDGDADPSENTVNVKTLVDSLGGEAGRGGVTLVYDDEHSRWWIELSPQPAKDQVWTFDFNRHFQALPETGEHRDAIFDWFANVEVDLLARFETICGGGS